MKFIISGKNIEVTEGLKTAVEEKIGKLDKYFTDYECPGRTGLSKGENNKLIIERNNLKNPVYVGDTEGDAESAKAAGIPFVFAKYGFGNVKEYQYAINKFEDLSTLKW